MSASIADLTNGVHITFKCNDLTDAELMSDKDFIISIFQLLIKFHYGSKGHKFESLPRWSEAVVGIGQMVSMDNRIAFEIASIDFAFEIKGIRTINNSRTHEPYRIGFIFIGKIVYERCAESYLDTVEIAHEQQTKVKIEVIEIDRILERSFFNIFMCSITEFGIRFSNGNK